MRWINTKNVPISLVKRCIKNIPTWVQNIKINYTPWGSLHVYINIKHSNIHIYNNMYNIIYLLYIAKIHTFTHTCVKLSFLHTLFNSSSRGRVNSKRDLFKVFRATLLPCNQKTNLKKKKQLLNIDKHIYIMYIKKLTCTQQCQQKY